MAEPASTMLTCHAAASLLSLLLLQIHLKHVKTLWIISSEHI